MQMEKIREIASWKNVVSGAMEKEELIRSIQEKEGNTPCFRTAQASCQQYDCWWRLDCKPGEIKMLTQYSSPQ
ncbi:MAG: SAP domain-containing protein [Desulfobulbaceae bacterium]|nr:SAP domain-containing protein [Desulfobulbaceae bacterium]